jgi:hypothetical protein
MKIKNLIKTTFTFIIFTLIAIPSLATSTLHQYKILQHGILYLNVPGDWKEIKLPQSQVQSFRIKYSAKNTEIHITYHWNLTQISNTNASKISLNRLKIAGESLLDRSLEKSLTIKHLKTKKNPVFYFTLTDKRKLQKGFKYLTHGSTSKGNFVLLVTIFSNSTGHPNILEALKMIGKAKFIYNKTPNK